MDHKQSSAHPLREVGSARLEGFSDAVLAVIITIMVLELRPPPGADLAALQSLIPGLLIYVLSFTVIGIYWNNHHHLLRATRRISGGVMWANLHLLFWLSLVPVVTTWVGAHTLSRWPAIVYGAIGFMAGVAYHLLTRILHTVNHDARIKALLQSGVKARGSLALIALGIALAFIPDPLGPLLGYAPFPAHAFCLLSIPLRIGTDSHTWYRQVVPVGVRVGVKRST